jgi:hypothetical protein
MIIASSSIETIKITDQLTPKTLVRKFGAANDAVELVICDLNDNIILTDENFTDYTPAGIIDSNGFVNSVDIDFTKVLQDYGFNSGAYKLLFSFQRRLVYNTSDKNLTIKEISPSRREIKVVGPNPDTFVKDVAPMIDMFGVPWVRDINMNMGNADYQLLVNAAVDTFTSQLLLKTYEPLPSNITPGTTFNLIEEIINPITITVDMGEPIIDGSNDLLEELKGPNLNVDFRLNSSIPSTYKNYDEILKNSVTSSFNDIQGYLSQSIQVDLDFDQVGPSGYTFENFIHFSSAVERLKNFNYKMGLIETYSSSIAELETITGPTSGSSYVIGEINDTQAKQNKVIQGFDYYERFLYYTSGTYAWPKENSSKPYTQKKTDSVEVLTWLGSENYSNAYYGGQLYSASMWDDCNVSILRNTLPQHISDNPNNEMYLTFVDMVGQHFDGIWAYIDSITDIPQADSKLTDGISKDLVWQALSQTGISAFDQFENADLFEYLLADDGQGTFQYQAPVSQSMVSASNDGSIPKGDITKEVWKRLYHNAPYLLKTKGTERGLKALIACYGIPETILHVKEYGGPVADKTSFRTFDYEKFTYMAGSNQGGLSVLSIAQWNSDGSSRSINPTQTYQLRALPHYDPTVDVQPPMDIISFYSGTGDVAIGISQSLDPSLINSGNFAHVVVTCSDGLVSSSLLPIYNGDVWNFTLIADTGSTQLTGYATNTTQNHNTYVGSCTIGHPSWDPVTMDGSVELGPGTSPTTYQLGPYSGSIQEFRAWFEILEESVIVTQSLSPLNYNGNSVSSSWDQLPVRSPLGSNLEISTLAIGNQNTQRVNPDFSAWDGIDIFSSNWIPLQETIHLTTPDTVGSAMVSDKVRIDSGSVPDDILSPVVAAESSPQDRQPLDYSDVGVFFSPTFEINEDIVNVLGAFRLDDYIGDPKHINTDEYPDLKDLSDVYFQRVQRRYNFWEYIKLIQYFDHTLWKLIEQFLPAKVNAKTGLVIEPHYLHRTKFGNNPLTTEQKTVHCPELNGLPNIDESSYVSPVNPYYNIFGYLDGSGGELENNAQQNRISSKYYSIVSNNGPDFQFHDHTTDDNGDSVFKLPSEEEAAPGP